MKDERSFSSYLATLPVLSKLERETRYWPMVYADTLTFTLAQVLILAGLKGQRSHDSHMGCFCVHFRILTHYHVS